MLIVLAIPAFHAPNAQPACRPISSSPLVALAGFWSVDWSYRLAPGNFLETKGSASISTDLLGCVLVERFTAAIDSIPFQSLVLYSAPEDGRLDRVFVDSQHGGLLRFDGVQSGDTLAFSWTLDLGSRVLRTRQLYILSSTDRFTREHLLSPFDGAPWELRQRAVYTRIEPSGQ